ncbi:MAG: glycoside hydrolase family 127 protein [Lachnospirales bacterium]
MLVNTKNSPMAKVIPLEWDKVNWNSGLWKEVHNTLRDTTVPHLQTMFESKDISHVLENFRICAGITEGEHEGTVFGDGDFYKWMESAIYIAGKENNNAMLNKIDEYIDLIRRTQLEDGYISTKQIIGEKTGKSKRLGDINEFEVYNMGHLFTSAALHFNITGKRNFLDIAEKAAMYLKKMYEEAKKVGEAQTAVCPSHYMGLMELYRATENKIYLELAKLAIEVRDMVKKGLDDNQDKIPLKDHREIVGHAVRANYLYGGLSDLLLEIEDEEYAKVIESVYKDLISSKIYITGGCGALYNGTSPYGNFFHDDKVHQAYGYHYQLPNVTAYNETCANIGLVMWCYRMFLKDPKSQYMDLIEKVMLNVNLAAINFDGNKYFYQNALRRTKDLPYELIWPLTRSEYILSYCCPPNLARNLSQSSEYIYTKSEDTLYTGLYGSSTGEIHLDSTSFNIEQVTNYPYDGKILFNINNIRRDGNFSIKFRIPNWVTQGYIEYENKKIDISNSHGYVNIDFKTKDDFQLELNFKFMPQIIVSHPYVEETTFQGAIEYGPLIYCLEGLDSKIETIDKLMIPNNLKFKSIEIEIANKKITALEGDMVVLETEKNNSLYKPLGLHKLNTTTVKMIPYFAWDNREFSEMKIWFPIYFNI